MMEATVFLGTFNAAECFWYPSPDMCIDTILSLSSMDNSFDLNGLVFALVDSYQVVKTSRMINGNRMHLR
jgi:hypothetical protein